MKPLQEAPRTQDRRPADATADLGLATFSLPSSDYQHLTFGPMHYEPGYAYPLIVWLHGPGDDERQLMRMMPMVSMRNYVAVAPQGVPLEDNEDAEKSSYGWPLTNEGDDAAAERVFVAIEAARMKYNFSRKRIFLAGFDQGGTMAFRLAAAHPDRFAGVVSLGGPFPSGPNPLASLAQLRGLPVLIASGRTSTIYPTDQVCDDLRLLHTAGLSITLREYPCGQEITPQMLQDVDRWIIEQLL
ncbi:MAG: alpha/beta hydrolase-fold protein [Planctomycetia bacterium]|jgi:phospholipase/carboxylesterase